MRKGSGNALPVQPCDHHGVADRQRCVQDLRLAPVRKRRTQFRLLQQNMLAYTFDAFVPGFAASSVLNDTPFAEVVQKPIDNANDEGPSS